MKVISIVLSRKLGCKNTAGYTSGNARLILEWRLVTIPVTIPGYPNSHARERFDVFTAVTMKTAVFLDIKTQSVPHRRHYVFAAEPSRLMLCRICGFNGGDSAECRLLG
jgi:hypothetical protein